MIVNFSRSPVLATGELARIGWRPFAPTEMFLPLVSERRPATCGLAPTVIAEATRAGEYPQASSSSLPEATA